MRLLGLHLRASGRLGFVVLLGALLGLLACSSSGGAIQGDLLSGLAPTRVVDVDNPARLTDGVVATEGDDWNTDLTSVLRGGLATVEWDLGRVAHVRAVYLQGDNNDDFFLSGSEDGQNYTEIWSGKFVRGAGMRARFERGLEVNARYLRLTARGGDSAVSASELAVFENTPDRWPPHLKAFEGKRQKLPGENETLVFGILACAVLLLHKNTWGSLVRVGAVAILLVAGYTAFEAVVSAWPPGQAVIDMARAVAAAVGAAAVLRIAWRPADVIPRLIDGTLAAMAFLALTTFFNMWQPQFDDVDNHGHTWVHTWDMRVYFPTAKYFDELGYDGLYVASVAAYLEDVRGASEQRLAHTELRDLRTYDMTTVGNVADQIHGVKSRFSPERWAAFKRDMSYFWKTMGPGGYLGSLRDHGGNATPFWIFVVYLMFKSVTATEPSLLVAALLDPLLLLGFLVAVLRTFGLRTALVSLIVYGTSTFPWFGSNWAGSTLRNDWMVLVGFGVCALKKERWALGGALLAAGAMIRAFPAMAVFFLVAPAILWVRDVREREGKFPDLGRILEEQRPLLAAAGGAAAFVGLAFLVSGLRFGFSHSWGEWAHKIGMHSVQPNVNHVGLRTLFQYSPGKTLRALSQTGGDWSVEQIRTLHARRPLYFVTIAGITLLAGAAARGRDLRAAALLGMMLIPIFFYPSNYYLHYVFVLPMLVDYSEEDRKRQLWGLVSFVLLAVSVSEYWGFDARGVDERYVQWSWGALAGYLVIFAALARDAWPEWGQKAAKAETNPAVQ